MRFHVFTFSVERSCFFTYESTVHSDLQLPFFPPDCDIQRSRAQAQFACRLVEVCENLQNRSQRHRAAWHTYMADQYYYLMIAFCII